MTATRGSFSTWKSVLWMSLCKRLISERGPVYWFCFTHDMMLVVLQWICPRAPQLTGWRSSSLCFLLILFVLIRICCWQKKEELNWLARLFPVIHFGCQSTKMCLVVEPLTRLSLISLVCRGFLVGFRKLSNAFDSLLRKNLWTGNFCAICKSKHFALFCSFCLRRCKYATLFSFCKRRCFPLNEGILLSTRLGFALQHCMLISTFVSDRNYSCCVGNSEII